MLVGFGGVIVMIAGAALHSPEIDVAALLVILSAALSFALAGVFGRRFTLLGAEPLTTAGGQVTASSVILCPSWFLWMPPGASQRRPGYLLMRRCRPMAGVVRERGRDLLSCPVAAFGSGSGYAVRLEASFCVSRR